jgi:DNA-binding PadR family transcriptional regulator
MKQRSILGPRDISVFYALHLHPALSLKQLAELCFSDVSYETARKRLRRLHQSGYMGAKTAEHTSDKGRPESLYFLNAKAAKALAENRNILENSIPIGAPNKKHQEYLAHLAQLHLAWQKTTREEKLINHHFVTKRAVSSTAALLKANEHADATISFTNKQGEKQTILLVLETGNLRPTRHWIPKMTALLKMEFPILVVTTSRDRLDTLRKWTLPMLEEMGLSHERCMFMVYEEIIRYGFLAISAYSTTGSAMKIPA